MARGWLRRRLPHPRALRENRALRWLGPLLDVPGLWKVDRRGVATGIAIGTFFGLLLPFAQILVAGFAAAWLRANLAAAVLATFISNPLTTPLILVGAYHVGAAVLGEDPGPPAPPSTGWVEQIAAMGEPLLVGVLVVAASGATLAYAAVLAAWRAASWSRLRRRRVRRAGTPCC